MPNTPEIVPSSEGGAIMLPYGAEDFSKFIANLLGKPQTLTRIVGGPFEISREGISNIDALIKQRIHSQNNGIFVQFVAQISYNDNSSITINDIDSFLSHNEIHPISSVSAIISWTFLIKFHDKPAPEKQIIQIDFVSEEARIGLRNRPAADIEVLPLPGRMVLRIIYTDRSWAADINSLVGGHLELYKKKSYNLPDVLGKNAGLIGWLLFLASAASVFWFYDKTQKAAFEKLQAAIQTTKAEGHTAADYLDLMIRILAPDSDLKMSDLQGALYIVALIASGVLAIFVSSVLGERRPSYVLFSTKALEKKAADEQGLRYNWMKLLGGSLVSLLTGLFGKYLYEFLRS